jgi:penicillin-binding protein 1A
LGGEDLAELILSGGGARATPDAPPELLAAEEQALAERLGSGNAIGSGICIPTAG